MKRAFALLILLAALSSVSWGQQECAPEIAVNSTMNFLDSQGVMHQWLGIDETTRGPSPIAGTVVICSRTFFNDSRTVPQAGKNAFVSINHLFGSGSTLQTNQDRALWVSAQNAIGDTTAHYSMTAIQSELTIRGSPNKYNGVDTEYTSGSFQTSDTHVGYLNSPALSINGLRVNVYRGTSDTWGSCNNATCWAGGRFLAVNTYAGALMTGGGRMAALLAYTVNLNWGYNKPGDNLIGVGLYVPTSTSPFPYSYGVELGDQGAGAERWNLVSHSLCAGCGSNRFEGPIVAQQDVRTGKATPTDLAGTGILPMTYTFAETFASPPVCIASDITTANAVLVQITRTTLTVSGTTGDAANYICIGRN